MSYFVTLDRLEVLVNGHLLTRGEGTPFYKITKIVRAL